MQCMYNIYIIIILWKQMQIAVVQLSRQVKQLLNFVVVGGGPTGVEFCGELSDFIKQDLKRPSQRVSPHQDTTNVLKCDMKSDTRQM